MDKALALDAAQDKAATRVVKALLAAAYEALNEGLGTPDLSDAQTVLTALP